MKGSISALTGRGIFLIFLATILSSFQTSDSEIGNREKSKEKKKPNIVVIVADDMGWADLGLHNGAVHTPNLDAFFESSIKMERFYTAPSCTPTRMGLLTGRYPDRMGFGFYSGVIHTNTVGGIPAEETTLPEILEQGGYKKRACIGKWHLGHSNVQYHPMQNGFSDFYGCYGGQIDYFDHLKKNELDWHRDYEGCYDKGYATDLIGNEAVRFVQEASDEEDPFFLYVSFTAPHEPLMAKEEDLLHYGLDRSQPLYTLPNDSVRSEAARTRGRGNTIRQTYLAMVTAMDASIGNLLQTLEREGIADNTIVLFMSDNGGAKSKGGYNKPLRGEKGKFFEGGIRVPAAIRWNDGGLQSGKVKEVVTFVDVLPTLCDLADVEVEQTDFMLDGFSAKKILDGEEGTAFEHRLFYVGRNSLIQGKWKLSYGDLYNIEEDLSEKHILNEQFPDKHAELLRLASILNEQIEKEIPRKTNFRIRHEWEMPQH